MTPDEIALIFARLDKLEAMCAKCFTLPLLVVYHPPLPDHVPGDALDGALVLERAFFLPYRAANFLRHAICFAVAMYYGRAGQL